MPFSQERGIFYFQVIVMLIWHFFRWLEEAGERREYKGLPRGCWHCEVLGLCRRPKEEGWKCYNGCMILNYQYEEKYKGLPKGCWRCKYLEKCRRPKEEGWKCYDGCRIIKKKQKKENKNKK
jgi:hypothetical protein